VLFDAKQNSGSAVWAWRSPSIVSNRIASGQLRRVRRSQNEPRQQRSDITSKPLPNLINPLIKRAKSGMNALVVKAKYIANHYNPEKPMVMIQVPNSLLCPTSDDANEA
jgi:hypothetical protein